MSGVHRKERGESRAIYAAVVHDLDFMPLSPAAKLLWYTLRLELGLSGIGVLYSQALPEVTGLSAFDVDAGLQELCVTQWLVRERNVMWLRNALRFDPYVSLANRLHVQAVVNHLSGLPKLKLVADFCRYYGIDQSWIEDGVPDDYKPPHRDTLYQWSAIPIPIQEVVVRSEELVVRSEELKASSAAPTAPAGSPKVKPKKKPRRVVNYSPEFLEVWAIHPRGGKAEAFDEYVAAVPERIGHEQLVAYLRLYVTTELNEKFRGHDLFRWIKKDRWEEYAIRRPVLSRDDPSTKLRNKAESMAEHLRNLGVA